MSDVSTIQITLVQYSVISQIRPNLLLDLSICPVLMRPMCPFGRNGKQNASIYSVHIYVEIPHIDANLTSLVKHSVKHLFNLYFFTRIINLL